MIYLKLVSRIGLPGNTLVDCSHALHLRILLNFGCSDIFVGKGVR